MATENKRNFTDEDIRKGRDGQIGLQVEYKYNNIMSVIKIIVFSSLQIVQDALLYKSITFMVVLIQAGQNQGATQAGHGGMGNTRHM